MKIKISQLKKQFYIAKRSLGIALKVSKWPTTMMFALIVLVSLIPFFISWVDNKIIDALIDVTQNIPSDLGAEGAGLLSSKILGFDPMATLIRVFVIGIIARIILQITWSMISYFEKIQYFGINEYMNLTTLRKISGLDIEHYEDEKTNDLIQKVRDSYTWRPSDYINELFWITRDVVGIIASATIILSFSPIVFLIIFVLSIPAFYVRLKFGKGSWNLHQSDATTRRMYWSLGWHLTEEKELFDMKVYKTRSYLLSIMKSMFQSFNEKEKKFWMKRNLVEGLFSNLSIIGTIIGEIMVVMAVISREITVGQFSFYSRTFLSFSESMGSLFHRFARAYEHSLYLEDIYKLFDMKPKINDGNEILVLKRPPLIEVRNLTFKYNKSKAPVFEGLNLKIEPGEKIAIIGENGAGKSTLVKLITRLYVPDSGQILIDGHDLANLKIDSWYKYVATLFQDFVLYGPFSVKRNIGMGRISKMNDMERVKKAVRQAKAEKAILSKPLGYEQKLSKRHEGGTDFSGGEQQRIALSRAFFRDALVLILDEPTSAIDAKAEAEIFDNLFEFAQDKTVIIISHRFSTVRNADRILVMDSGKIVEEGTHERLMALNGIYARMFRIQAQGYK